MTGAFDRRDQLTLIFCTGSGDAFWNDLALFSDELPEQLFIFVIDPDRSRFRKPARAFFPNLHFLTVLTISHAACAAAHIAAACVCTARITAACITAAVTIC